MTEEKKKRLKGFAGIVSKQVEPLNSIEKFKEDFKEKELKILLNAKDGKIAALLIIDKGRIFVEAIENQPKENIEKKKVGWDGLLQAKTQVFVDLLGGDSVSMGSIIGKILTGRIKIRGIKKVLVLLELFKY
ncbi:MAG: hypothetical protein ACFFA2_14815 [Promethearchaeota archaeon]